MNLWSVENFLTIFVITFGYVCCCFAVAPTQKWWQKWPRNVQLIRKKLLHTYKIHALGPARILQSPGPTGNFFKFDKNKLTQQNEFSNDYGTGKQLLKIILIILSKCNLSTCNSKDGYRKHSGIFLTFRNFRGLFTSLSSI